MITEKQKEQARIFKSMHDAGRMFVLPNAWNAGSARVFEREGFRAVATSSAGFSYALGYPDGQAVPFGDLLHVVGQMTARVDIPVSVDFERGYSDEPEQVRENARQLCLKGAVGFNIEDGLPDGTLSPLELQIEKIRTLAGLKRELDLDFVINARTCVYWLNVGSEEDRLKTAILRGNAFREAGADCVFVPGAIDRATVGRLVNGINAPVNILLNRAFHDVRELERIGVRRLSVGSGPARWLCERMIGLARSCRTARCPAFWTVRSTTGAPTIISADRDDRKTGLSGLNRSGTGRQPE